jgi:hypothetical protein
MLGQCQQYEEGMRVGMSNQPKTEHPQPDEIL